MNGLSLKARLTSMTVGLVLAIGLMSLLVMKHIIGDEQEARVEAFAGYARSLNDAIGAQFFERYGDVQAFALNPALQASKQATIVEALNAYAVMYGIYDLIMVVDASGRLVAVNDKAPSGSAMNVESLYKENFSNQEWFKRVMSGSFTEDKERAFAGTFVEDVQVDPYVSGVMGGKRLGSSFSAPIKNQKGETIGVITNRAGSRWFEVAFQEMYAALKDQGLPSTDFMMMSKDGTLFFEYHPSKNGMKMESTYNFDRLLTFNLDKTDFELNAARKLGKNGGGIAPHEMDRVEQIVGYTPINSRKFVEALGWQLVVRDDRSEALYEVNKAESLFYIVLGIGMMISLVVAYWFSSSLSKKLSHLAGELATGATAVSSASDQIATTSSDLSESSTEQAAAIQETASAIDEVNAMVRKNSENAQFSKESSEKSRSQAQQGQKAVTEMIDAIGQISESNEQIMNQVTEGNRRISEIVQVISAIGEKTKVINDIVFQTKLLSFNASVEAARAGEHGKGFAVVAEEVGNLAAMSGNAAKEISGMLDESIQRVERIVTETKAKVEGLVVTGKTKVEMGKMTAQRCGESLESILTAVEGVDGMVAEIATASKEQSQGVEEITSAINQLDQVTQKNSSLANQASSAADSLNQQSDHLRGMVGELLKMVSGRVSDLSGSTHRHEQKAQSSNSGKVLNMPKKKSRSADSSPKKHAMISGDNVPASSAQKAETSVPSHEDSRFQDV